jgi:hypothetical protein
MGLGGAMKTLLTSIQALLKTELDYVRGVAIVPDFFIFPEEAGFPLIGILDNGDEVSGREKGARIERLRVSIGFYQAIAKPEASVIGDARNKGILEIRDDAMNALRDESFGNAYLVPFYIGGSKVQALETRDYEGFVAFKSIDLEYLKEVVEST